MNYNKSIKNAKMRKGGKMGYIVIGFVIGFVAGVLAILLFLTNYAKRKLLKMKKEGVKYV